MYILESQIFSTTCMSLQYHDQRKRVQRSTAVVAALAGIYSEAPRVK